MKFSYADIQNMLKAADGETITVDGTEMIGSFREPYVQVQLGNTVVEEKDPQVSVASADVAAMGTPASHGSTVVIGADSYTVREIQRKGNGFTIFFFREA